MNKPKAVQAAEAAECLRLQLSGLTVRAIAQELGLKPTTVQNRLTMALAAVIIPGVETLRTREGERLLHLLDRIQPAVQAGDLGAIKTAARLSESYRRLYGLNAPEQHQHQITEATQMDLAVQELIRNAHAKTQLAEEVQG